MRFFDMLLVSCMALHKKNFGQDQRTLITCDFWPLYTVASKLVEAGGRASVIKSEKWTKSLDFYIITHVLKSEAGNFVTFNQG